MEKYHTITTIPITKPFLPPYEEYQFYMNRIWQEGWITNNGSLVIDLEQRLKQYLKLENLLYLTSGTMALQIAIKALGIKGEVITTPFSYVATTSAIVWEGCDPIFVDINERTLNIDPSKIKQAITPRTSAILATHCFGNPCDIVAIQKIAEEHRLRIIYDAAHCFGSTFKRKSVFEYGDVSTTSFHAIKLFHTVEGGAVVTQDLDLLNRMDFMRNFGHCGPGKFKGIGINGKNSEFHAAMGLSVLSHMPSILARRKEQYLYYQNKLSCLDVQTQAMNPDAEYNYAYFAIIFKTETLTLNAMRILEANRIFPRRYFYPALSSLDYVHKQETPVATDIAKRVLCLPLYHDLTRSDQDMIGDILLRNS